MSETEDEPASSTQKQPQHRKRPQSLRTKYEAVFPIVRLTEPFYGDTTCPHSVLCGLNRPTQSTASDDVLTPAIWQSTYPVPVFDGALVDPKTDICLELAKRKKLFIRNVQSIKQCYQKNKSKIEAEVKQIPKSNANTMMVKKFAETLETDPDKYFNGTYDWYFTGGSMDIVDVDGQEFVVHSEGNELENLKITEMSTDGSITATSIYDAKTRSMHKGSTIYEIKSVADEAFFTVRQKHQMTVINLRFDTLKLLKIHSEIPLVTSAVDSSMKLILVDVKQHLQLFNLIDVKPISRTEIFSNRMTIDNWSSVRFIDSNRFICASRKIVSIYDIRQSIEPVMLHDLTGLMGPCEDLTCMEHSANSQYTFVATTHKLHALDMRNVKKDIVPSLTWIHQMKTAPIFMDICRKDSAGELIAIAGIKSGDVRLFDTAMSNNELKSTHLSYTPVSVHDAFKFAQSVGRFLDPNSLVQRQLRQSNSGIKLKSINSEKFSLLTKNNCGDIFQQNIERKDGNVCSGDDQYERLDKLIDWDKQLRHRVEKENKLGARVTDITNFQSMVSYLRSNMHKEIDRTKTMSNIEPQPWEMSIEELASYQDVLANSLLDKWIIAQDVEMEDVDVKYTDDRMSNWVDSTVDQQYQIFEEDICVKDEPEIREY